MAQIPLEEAIRLGLVREEDLQSLMAQGILTSPFARAGGGASPYWRLPAVTRGGLYTPRFGLGPLSQGLALSPPAPAISGGGVPVGRRAGGGSQAPADLQTLIGSGDVNEIARRVQAGTVDLNALPAGLRQQVMQILSTTPSAHQQRDEEGAAAQDAQKALAVTKQVLGLAKTLVPKGSQAEQIIAQQEQQALGQTPGQEVSGETAPGATAARPRNGTGLPEIPNAPPPTAPTGQIDVKQLEAMGLTPDQIAQIAGALPAGAAGQVPMQGLSLNGQEMTFSPANAVGTDVIMAQNDKGIWEAIPKDLQDAIAAGAIDRFDVKALANQGYTGPEIQDALMGTGGDSGLPDVGEFSPPGGAPSGGAGVAGAGVGGIMGGLTIGQAIADPNLNPAQKALRSTSGASQIAQGVAPILGLGEAVPYLGAAAGLANIAAGAAGPGPSDQKAAAAAIDAAAAAVTTGLAMTGYGALLIPFVQPIAGLVKQNILEAFGLSHKQREALETRETGGMVTNLIKQIQGTKTAGELYEVLRAWSTPLVGGATQNNDPRLQGLDPTTKVNVMAKGPAGPDWDYLGLYGSGALNPAAPTPEQFFDRVLKNPNELQVQVQAGVKPELIAPMNTAILNSLREQIAEVRVRDMVRPNLLAFSRMAGVIVTEDDVVNALRQTGGVMDSPDFPEILRQSERVGAGNLATTQAMADQPFLVPANQEKKSQLYAIGQLQPDRGPDVDSPEYAYQRQVQDAGGTYEQRYPAVEAGYSFKPGVGWVAPDGTVALATGALPAPEPFVEPAPVPQPPSTATPASGPTTDANGAPLPSAGQSNIPPGSPLAPDEPLQPLGIMHEGGVVPRTGPYILAKGETVIPAGRGGLNSWNIEGYLLPSTTEPLPTLKHPGMYWIQDEENQWHVVDPRDYEPAPAGGQDGYDQEAYYLDPKRGVPFAKGKNPDPSKTWRLVFDPDELPEAWKNRQKDGAPLLVPRSVLGRRDWSDVVEQARQSQYVAVHPAVLLAREMPQSVLGTSEGYGITEDQDMEANMRFWRGLDLGESPLPQSEKTPPMREMPGRRPMTPEERQQIDWPPPTKEIA